MRGVPSEFIQASTDVLALKLSGKEFISLVKERPSFANHFNNLTNDQEAYLVAIAAAELEPKQPEGWRKEVLARVKKARTNSLYAGETLDKLDNLPEGWLWHLSTPNVPGIPVGTALKKSDEKLPSITGFALPYRFIAIPEYSKSTQPRSLSEIVDLAKNEENIPTNLQELGILEDEELQDDERHPVVKQRDTKRRLQLRNDRTASKSSFQARFHSKSIRRPISSRQGLKY